MMRSGARSASGGGGDEAATPGRHPIALNADLCYNVRSFLGEIAAIRPCIDRCASDSPSASPSCVRITNAAANTPPLSSRTVQVRILPVVCPSPVRSEIVLGG